VDTADLIIVGAGSAGCVLAHRLSADPQRRVVLLEAGGADRHPLIAVPLAWTSAMTLPAIGWGYTSEPEAASGGRSLPMPRGRVLGGTSSINGMMYTRGNPGDYDAWAARGLPGWDYASVLPYFQRAESNWRGAGRYHGDAGPLTVGRHPQDPFLTPKLFATAERLGYRILGDFAGPEAVGFGIPDFTIRGGRRLSTARAYLAPARGRGNLRVLTGAQVTRVLLEGGRATGVEYVRSGRREVLHGGEVILAAGAFDSPRLLMLSGIGPAEHLREVGVEVRHALPGVGGNLQDHPLIPLVYAAAGPYALHELLRLDRLALAGLQWALLGRGPLTHMPLAAQGFVKLDAAAAWPDTQFQVSAVSMLARPWFPLWRQSAGHHFTATALQLRPQGRGDIRLQSADPLAPPRIRLGLLQHEADRRAVRGMIRFVRQFFATEPAASLVRAELAPGAAAASDAELDAYARGMLMTGMHPTSTCAMGVGPEAVVDAELRVHGIEGLRVVDGSVMPVIVSGNTNAPIIMIAEKAADLVLGRAPPPAA